MDPITWTGTLGPVLLPLMALAVAVFALAVLANFAMTLAGLRPGEMVVNADHSLSLRRTPVDHALTAMRGAVAVVLLSCTAFVVGGLVLPDLAAKGILGAIGQRLWPVWLALLVTFALSIAFKRRLGLYGKLFDSPIGMVGFGLVLFWMFTAIFADAIVTFGAIDQISQMRHEPPGSFVPEGAGTGFPVYLLGGDTLGRDVFSRTVMGAREVLKIAPAATLFAFMVGITLGLPAGYFGGRLDAVVTFLANLVLAFPVILLFYLLVTPEIVDAGIPTAMAAVLFLFPILFFVVLFNSRYHVQPAKRGLALALTLVLGFWLYAGLAFDADPLGLVSMPGNILIVFVSVVFVNAPTVFRIVRGLTLDIKTRDYVAASQTRGEGAWYIMLWEILPNVRGPLIVDFCLRIGYTTILLGTLGFFGLGVSPESPDWGSTINEGRRLLTRYAHPALPPALSLMSLVLGLNLLADGLREESLKD